MSELVRAVARKICCPHKCENEGVEFAVCQAHTFEVDAHLAIEAVFDWMAEPSDEAIATVVQQVGDPAAFNWAQAERVCATLGGPRMEGETAVAELARDWTAMLAQLRKEALG